MKVILPTRETKVNEKGEVTNIDKEVEFELDMSLASQMRYEAKFPMLAEHEDLHDYLKRVETSDDKSAAAIISKMKAIYCWFDTDISFVDFVKMFSSADKEYSKKLGERMDNIIKIIMDGASEKN